jgi:ankyrin repeat protein
LTTNTNDKLDRLQQLINEPLVKSRLPNGYYEGITEHLNNIRVDGADAVPDGLLQNLVELVDEYEGWLVKFANLPPVFSAAREGDLLEVRSALDAGFDIHQRDPDGMTLLMLAAVGGHQDVASLLIDRGGDVLALCQDDNAFDALMMACADGRTAVVELLLDHGANVNSRYAIPSSRGHIGNQTALSISANRGHLDVCRLLISRGADLEVAADSGYTALMWSLVNGASEEAAELLLNAGAKPDPGTLPTDDWSESKTTPLILSASNSLAGIALRLIESNVNLDVQDGSGSTALKHASRNGVDSVVKALINKGADLNLADEEGWTPLISAASRAAWGAMQQLIDAGADVNHSAHGGNTALREVVSRRLLRHGIVFLSRLSGREVGADHEEGYELALEFAEQLLEAGANPNVSYEDDSEQKLIDAAIDQGDNELAELLAQFGAEASEHLDQDEADEAEEISEGDQLIRAAANLDIDEISDLIDQGVDVNYLDADGDTPLSYSVIKLCIGDPDPGETRDLLEQIDLLLFKGAMVDVPGSRIAPLPMVARSGRVGLVNAFLDSGANISAVLTDIDEDAGKTALEVAREAGHQDVEAALLKAGAA